MGFRGTLTKDNLGFSMPSDGPLYPKPPYLYQNATLMLFAYETDGPTAARLLPSQAELPDPATAGLVFASYPSSTIGPYEEVVLFLDATYGEQAVKYAVHLYVTTDVAMAAGREMAGFPKKIGAIDFEGGDEYNASLERPPGLRLASGSMKLVKQLGAGLTVPLSYLTLRVIPSPTKDAPPSLAELIQTDWVLTDAEVWEGAGTCRLTGASVLDALQLVPILNLTSCQLLRGNLEVALNEKTRSESL